MTKHNTAIEWTHIPGYKGETWNPIVGCSIASPGCKNCYAMRVAHQRLDGNPKTPHYARTTEKVNGKPVWTGKVARASEKTLTNPLRWKKPRAIFVNSMGDLFHENVPDEWIDQVFAVMALAPQHIFIVLTKRSERMREYMNGNWQCRLIPHLKIYQKRPAGHGVLLKTKNAALPNVWLGVSVEDQKRADERIPHLLETPAAIRFISAEPLLGKIDLGDISLECRGQKNCFTNALPEDDVVNHYKLDWVIAGGESGPGARPMHPDWVRNLRDQCEETETPFFFKQWGAWKYPYDRDDDDPDWRNCDWIQNKYPNGRWLNLEGGHGFHGDRVLWAVKAPKQNPRYITELDGIIHGKFPKCVEVEKNTDPKDRQGRPAAACARPSEAGSTDPNSRETHK